MPHLYPNPRPIDRGAASDGKSTAAAFPTPYITDMAISSSFAKPEGMALYSLSLSLSSSCCWLF